MNGGVATSTAQLLGPGNWTVTHTGDFNGDGKADILLRNDDGSVALWLMNGTTLISGAGLLGPNSGWSVTHVADFNGDGKADILFSHTDGRVAMWLMNGSTLVSGAGLLEAASGWSVTHTGDFNGDGKADILFRHADGRIAMWLMNGLTLTSGAGLLEATSGWSVTHTGDFNGDGKSDILFRHTDGRVAMWLMNELTFTSGAGLLADPNWSVSHVGDFNGDGKTDILWRNTNGSVTAWLMNGLSLVNGVGLFGADPNWRVTHIGDYNGDGKADIVWRNASDGSIVLWLLDGATVLSQTPILGASPWMVLPAQTVTAVTVNKAQRKVNDVGAHHILFRTSVDGGVAIDFTPSASNAAAEWHVPARRFGLSVGLYHENPSAVDAQISALRQSGANTVAFDLWNLDLTTCEISGACNDGYLDGVYGEVLDNGLYGLRPQHRANLQAMLNKVKQVGFGRVVIRFNHYWPSEAQNWDETLYQKTLGFVRATRELVETNLAGSQTESLYDLGGEMAGLTNNQVSQFVTRMWKDYVSSWGNSKTVGFSFAWAPGRFNQAIQIYQSAGTVLPKTWAFDVYAGFGGQPGSMRDLLFGISNEMGSLNGQPIIILETWFNNIDMANSLESALNGPNKIVNLNLDGVLQWPLIKEQSVGAQNANFTQAALDAQTTSNQLSAYIGLKSTHKLRLQNSDSSKMVIRDMNCAQTMSSVTTACLVEHYTAAAPAGKFHHVVVNGNTLACVGQQPVTQEIPWIVAGQTYTFKLYEVTTCPSSTAGLQEKAASAVEAIF